MKFYKHINWILWVSYVLVILAGIIISIIIFLKSEFEWSINSIGILIIPLISLMHTILSPKWIKKISKKIYSKGHLNEFSTDRISYLQTLSDNENILPFKKLIIRGFGKDIEELNEEDKKLSVWLREDDDFRRIESQISLIFGKWFLPEVSKNKLLDERSLQALRLIFAKKINIDPDVLLQINEVIKKNSKDTSFNDWFDKWKTIDSFSGELSRQKDIILEFIKPKFENIAKSNLGIVKKIDEINFLIDNLLKRDLEIVFIDANLDVENEQMQLRKYFSIAKSLLKKRKYVILASRGKNNTIQYKMATGFNLDQKYFIPFPMEKDVWVFNNNKKVSVMWSIIGRKE